MGGCESEISEKGLIGGVVLLELLDQLIGIGIGGIEIVR